MWSGARPLIDRLQRGLVLVDPVMGDGSRSKKGSFIIGEDRAEAMAIF